MLVTVILLFTVAPRVIYEADDRRNDGMRITNTQLLGIMGCLLLMGGNPIHLYAIMNPNHPFALTNLSSHLISQSVYFFDGIIFTT
jgi:hypothetical protein